MHIYEKRERERERRGGGKGGREGEGFDTTGKRILSRKDFTPLNFAPATSLALTTLMYASNVPPYLNISSESTLKTREIVLIE